MLEDEGLLLLMFIGNDIVKLRVQGDLNYIIIITYFRHDPGPKRTPQVGN